MALVVATIFLGRFFCGFICPLGTLNHMTGAVRPSLKGKALIAANQDRGSPENQIFSADRHPGGRFAGNELQRLVRPHFHPFSQSGPLCFSRHRHRPNRVFSNGWAKVIPNGSTTSGTAPKILSAPVLGYGYKAFQTGLLIGVLFLVILFLNRIRPRFWCRVICPLGALLGVFSRYRILRLEKDESKCTHCGACVKSCQGAASSEPGKAWQGAECLDMFQLPGQLPGKSPVLSIQMAGRTGSGS